jgi:hypothetical protein
MLREDAARRQMLRFEVGKIERQMIDASPRSGGRLENRIFGNSILPEDCLDQILFTTLRYQTRHASAPVQFPL